MSLQKIVPLGVRLPVDVRQWLEATARRNLRSQNAEIILALREKMRKPSEVVEPRDE